MQRRGNMSSKLSSNSEAFASELLDNLEDMFLGTDDCMAIYNTKQRLQMVNSIFIFYLSYTLYIALIYRQLF